MKISVMLSVSQETNHITIDLEDTNFTQEEWDNLSHSEQESAIQNAIDCLPEQPYWVVDTFNKQ